MMDSLIDRQVDRYENYYADEISAFVYIVGERGLWSYETS